MDWFPNYNYILASKSPRRQQLLHGLGIEFEVRLKEVNETYPEEMEPEEIPVYLAHLKAEAFRDDLMKNDLLITADTIVSLNRKVIGKPVDIEEAVDLLHSLSGKEHQVISGVCLTSTENQKSFRAITNVQFKTLTEREIDYYVHTFSPLDKAGAYGIQEWIGYIGISHIKGSFYNVMGLPIQNLYDEIMKF